MKNEIKRSKKVINDFIESSIAIKKDLIQSIELKNIDVTKSIDNPYDDSILHLAYRLDLDLKYIAWLLDQPNINYNAKNVSGNTPLHIAIQIGSMKKIELLLKKLRLNDLDIKNNFNTNPLAFVRLKYGYRSKMYKMFETYKKKMIKNIKI